MRVALLLSAILLVPTVASAQDECANVMLVVDRSESMERVDDDATPRWDEVLAAVEQIVTDYSDGVRFGLVLFPGDTDVEECHGNCEPGDVVVEIGSGTGDAILAAMNASRRCQTTPIGATLETLVSYPALRDDDRMDYIILVTDGADNCPLGDEVQAAGEALAWGILTHVVGFDFGEINPLAVNAIADAGGTGAAVIADDAAALQEAFDEILGSLYRDPEFGCVGGGDSDVDSDSDTDTDTETDTSVDGDGDADSPSESGGCGCRVGGIGLGREIGLAAPLFAFAFFRRRSGC